ncbi:hypothetical protein, partial [Escherichia coli]|uniref:hypothetical protein n=1 Tax=Escherichia coli TaxID=562 RepID=UPI001AA18BEE
RAIFFLFLKKVSKTNVKLYYELHLVKINQNLYDWTMWEFNFKGQKQEVATLSNQTGVRLISKAGTCGYSTG